MKRFLLSLIVAALAFSAPVQAAIVVVQSAAGTQAFPGGIGCNIGGTGCNTGMANTYNFTAGNTIIVPCANYTGAGGADLTTASDGTNSYSQAISNTAVVSANVVINASYSSNISAVTAGNAQCVAVGMGSNVIAGVFLEVSGLNNSSALDTAVTNTGNPTTTATPSITSAGASTVANELFVGCVIQDNVANVLSMEASGWTSLPDTFSISGGTAIHCAYKTVSSTGSQTYAPVFTVPTTWAAMIFSFKAPGGGGSVSPLMTTLGAGPG